VENKLQRYTSLRIRHIEKDICKLPGGVIWWGGLPEKGKRSPRALRRRWATDGYSLSMPRELKEAMLKACFRDAGFVDEYAQDLYYWMKEWLYSEDDNKMYGDCFKIIGLR